LRPPFSGDRAFCKGWVRPSLVLSSRPEQRRLLPLRSGGIVAVSFHEVMTSGQAGHPRLLRPPFSGGRAFCKGWVRSSLLLLSSRPESRDFSGSEWRDRGSIRPSSTVLIPRVAQPCWVKPMCSGPLLCLFSLPSYFLKWYPVCVQPNLKPKSAPPAGISRGRRP